MIVFSSPHHRKWKLPKIRCDFLEPRTLVGSESRTPGIRLRGVFFFNDSLFGGSPNDLDPEPPFLGKLSSLPRPVPAAPSRIGLVGPAWTRGEMERPAGTQDMGTYKTLARRPGENFLGKTSGWNEVPKFQTPPIWVWVKTTHPMGQWRSHTVPISGYHDFDPDPSHWVQHNAGLKGNHSGSWCWGVHARAARTARRRHFFWLERRV